MTIGVRTRVALPVKIVARVAVAFKLQPEILSSRAVSEWNVVVRNIVEEVDLILLQ